MAATIFFVVLIGLMVGLVVAFPARSKPDGGWVQDPSGGWHQARRMSPGAKLTALAAILAIVGGGLYWNWKADQDRVGSCISGIGC